MRHWLAWILAGSLAIIAPTLGILVSSSPGDRPVPGLEEYRTLTFSTLSSFPYCPPSSRSSGAAGQTRPDPFPEAVRALDGRKVSITGYVVPLSMKSGRIDRFYLSRGGTMGCCFADMPRINDYIKVTMAPGLFAPNSDLARVAGVLEVGEEMDSAGSVDTVYRLRADFVRAETNGDAGWADAVIWGVAGVLILAIFGPVAVRLIKLRLQNEQKAQS